MADVCAEHQCMVTELAELKRDMQHNTALTGEVLRAVKGGNGSLGLVTQTELNKGAIDRAWWWLGGISLFLLGICGWIIKRGY